jgi:hypothetical protein
VPDSNALAQLQILRTRYERPENAGLRTTEATEAFRLAFRALADKDAEIARLKAQLDQARGTSVLLATQAHIEQMLLIGAGGAMDGVRDGTVLRATDTGAEYELRGGTWLPRE